MRFRVFKSFNDIKGNYKNFCALIHTNWDDWYRFETEYVLHYFDNEGHRFLVGRVKIGEAGLQGESSLEYSKDQNKHGKRVPTLPNCEFEKLDATLFSLGTEDSYYEFLGKNKELQEILIALNDVAYSKKLFRTHKNESVLSESLMRGIARTRIDRVFNPLSHNRAKPTEYAFEYTFPNAASSELERLSFKVLPDATIPSNVKVIVGRNGVGKTYLLEDICYSICGKKSAKSGNQVNDTTVCPSNSRISKHDKIGKISFTEGKIYGVVYASLSRFDDHRFLDLDHKVVFKSIGFPTDIGKEEGRTSTQSGTNTERDATVENNFSNTQDKMDGKIFAHAIVDCYDEPFRDRWIKCMQLLETDPVLRESEITELMSYERHKVQSEAEKLYNQFSSGHAAIVLIITQLVRYLNDSFLVLIDEPECFLHPPLLSTFIRCLSSLLKERNAVSIIATHSPVVLQEVPRDSVWIINRHRQQVHVRNPNIETFGESIGILMNEVFGLEMEQSGFHQILSKIAEEGDQDRLNEVESKLGVEARAILRIMIDSRRHGNA